MFYKLALRNVRQSIRNYLLYFMTLTFGVCIFYVFNAIDAQNSMMMISQSTKSIMQTLTQLMGVISVFVSVILAILIVGSNSFLIRRRKKELGTYMILGMEKSKVSRILVIETLLIGIFSLAVGLLIGVFISQWMSVFMARLFAIDMTQFTFVISWPAILKTIIYFGLIFILAMLFSTVSISRYKLIDLINAGRKNEKPHIKNPILTLVMFMLSLACIGVAYAGVLKNGITIFDNQLLGEIVLGAIGTFLFFASLSGFFLKLIQMRKKLYYSKLNMFVLRQINSRINTAHISLSLICLMLFCTIGILSTGLGVNKALDSTFQAATPSDVTITSNNDASIKEYLQKNDFDLTQYVSQSVEFHIYQSTDIMGSSVLSKMPVQKDDGFWYYALQGPITIMKQSDHNALAAMYGMPALMMNSDQVFLYSTISARIADLQTVIDETLLNPPTVVINDRTVQIQSKLLSKSVSNSLDSSPLVLIVPDELVTKGVSVVDDMGSPTFLSIICKGDRSVTQDKMEIALNGFIAKQGEAVIYFSTKNQEMARMYGAKAIVLFVGLYLGVIFLITSAAILALQQMSEVSDNRHRYAILKKIGADDRTINQAVFKQTAIYFLLPLLLAIVHSVVGITVANRAVTEMSGASPIENILITAALILVVYGAYFLATYWGCRNMITRNLLSAAESN